MGLLLAGLGGMASQGIDIIDQRQKREAEEAAKIAAEERATKQAEFASQLAMKREETLLKLRERMAEEAKAKEKLTRADEMTQVAAEADVMRGKKDLSTAQQRAPSLDETGMGMIKASLSPEDRKKYYGVSEPTAREKLADQVDVAGKKGFIDTEKTLSGRYDKAVNEENVLRDDAFREKESVLNQKYREKSLGLQAAGNSLQREINQLTLDEKKKAIKLMDDYTAAKDPAEKAKFREQLVLHGVIKEKEPTDKVVEYVYGDPNDPEKKTGERTRTVQGQSAKSDSNTGGSQVRYDKQGNAYVRGPDGNPVPMNQKPTEATPAITKANVEIGTPASDSGVLSKTQRYNVTVNGKSALMTVDELERLGFSFAQKNGRKYVDPNYNKKPQ